MKDYNQTCEDRFVKTTINIRPRMMAGVHERMLELSKEDFIDYLRDLIRLDLKYKILGTYNPVSLGEFREEIGWEKAETAKEALNRIRNNGHKQRLSPAAKPRRYSGPPKRYPGFGARMAARFYRKNWWHRRNDDWKQEQVALPEENT